MSTEIDTSLQLSKVIAADPETVFRAWTDPEQVKMWSCPEGVMIDDVQIDLTVGGQYRICMKGDEGAWTAVGTYREIEPPRRLVYTWDWEEKEHKMSQHDRLSGSGETIVTVEFKDLDGSTEVVLTHELFPSSEAKAGHETGWLSCLSKLEGMFA